MSGNLYPIGSNVNHAREMKGGFAVSGSLAATADDLQGVSILRLY
jgi:hypothetical protein